jgi:hypothetical protein
VKINVDSHKTAAEKDEKTESRSASIEKGDDVKQKQKILSKETKAACCIVF